MHRSRIILGLAWALSAVLHANDAYLVKVDDLQLPGRCTRFDYQSLDPKAGRLYLSHMGDGHLVVVATGTLKVLADLPGYLNATGVLAIPKLQRVYVSVPGNHQVAVLDTGTLKAVARIPAGRFPDGIAYAPKVHKVYVSDESGGHETIIDAAHDQLIGTLDLGGEAGNTQYDPGTGHIFVNVQTLGEMFEIDPNGDRILARHKLRGGVSPHGLLIDAPARLAFAACEGDAKLLVIDLKHFHVIQVLATGDAPDVLAFDPGLGRLYVACESGVVSIFDLAHGRLQKWGEEAVGANCHTVAVDPQSHLLYFPLKNVDGHPVLRVMRPCRSRSGRP